jgi:hypothetical protein
VNAPGGYYLMYRGWMKTPALIGRNKERFCKFAAWAWLIEEAAWCDRTVNVAGHSVLLHRGQLSFAVRYLAEAWLWPPSSTQNFLDRLEAETMIRTHLVNGQSVISICNYDKYQARVGGYERPHRTDVGEGSAQTLVGLSTNEKEVNSVNTSKEIQETTSPGAKPPPNAAFGLDLLGDPPAKSARQILWADGIPIARLLTGKPESACRTMLGKMLRETRDDCSRLMSILHEAQSMHPLANAEAWLMEAARGRDRGNSRQPFNRLAGLKEYQDILEGRGPAPAYDIEGTAEEIP